jgi:hypothetical protein
MLVNKDDMNDRDKTDITSITSDSQMETEEATTTRVINIEEQDGNDPTHSQSTKRDGKSSLAADIPEVVANEEPSTIDIQEPKGISAGFLIIKASECKLNEHAHAASSRARNAMRSDPVPGILLKIGVNKQMRSHGQT